MSVKPKENKPWADRLRLTWH